MSGIENCTSVPKSDVKGAFGRKGPASFGDEGLTATANAYGHLIHITRYIGGDPCDETSFICADFAQNKPHSDSEPAPDWELPENTSTTLQDESRLDLDRKRELNHLQLLNRMSTTPQVGSRLGIFDSIGPRAHGVKVPQLSFLHNRWPLFKTKVTGGYLNVQYFIHKGIVYQRYTHSVCATPEAEEPSATTLSGTVRLLGIDFPKKPSKVPHLHAKHLCPYRPRGNESDHSPSDTESDDEFDDGTSVFDDLVNTPASSESEADVQIWLFQGDHQCEFSIEQSGRSIIVHDLSWEDALSAGQLDLTVAYVLTSKCQDTFDFPSQGLRYVMNQLALPFEAPRLDLDQDLNFMILRNVEHILSVYSITMTSQEKHPIKRLGESTDSKNISPVVLTCGDVSRHRVVTQASFHAFRFLLWASEKLAPQEEAKGEHDTLKLESASHATGIQGYYDRISAVCAGHVEWLCKHWKANTRGQSDRGERAKKEHEALFGVETALQIIKLGGFLDSKLTPTNTTSDPKELVNLWLHHLNETKRNGLPMVSRYENNLSRFDLVDHALIWWALRSAEKLGWSPKFPYNAYGKLKRQISPQDFKAIILKRFTTNNTTMKSRMLARSRSVLETDFILGPQDTALFYAEKCGLFNRTSSDRSISLWEHTLECQKYSDDNEPSGWNRPLDFGLAVILCSQNKAVNSEEPATMYQTVRSTLLRELSSSGLSTGQCSWFNEGLSSMNEKNHDSYWSTQFEVPYILATSQSPKENTEKYNDLPKAVSRLNQILVEQNAANKGDTVMKQRLPFGEHISVKHIVELPDRWLYDEPKFLDFKPKLPDVSMKAFWEELENGENTLLKSAIGQAFIEQLRVLKESRRICWRRALNRKCIEWIVSDTQSTPSSQQSTPINLERSRTIMRHSDGWHRDDWREHEENLVKLRDHLQSRRRNEQSTSRKRFLQFFRIQPTAALVCYLASAERDVMARFFSRHARYETYHDDQAIKMTNKWVTELHLSFWTLENRNDRQKDVCLPHADWVYFPQSEPKHNRGQNKTKSGSCSEHIVQRAIVSFIFDGDFLDRYWTCHFIQHSIAQKPRTYRAEAAGTKTTRSVIVHDTFDIKNEPDMKHAWKQRRVLEVVLFQRALDHMVISAETLLDAVKSAVRDSFLPDDFQPDSKYATLAYTIMLLQTSSNDDYVSASRLGHKLQYLLQAVQESLEENLKIIELWLNREKERERPQWTKEEEYKYGDDIAKWQVLNKQRILDLRQCHGQIKSYNDALTRKLEDIHRELEFRGNNGIRLFTYVTVVFLPIGFGTGLFSMSEVPSVSTLVWMIGVSAIALLLTVVALANAKVLEINVKKPITRLGRFFSFLWRCSPFGWLWSLCGWIWSLLRWLWSPFACLWKKSVRPWFVWLWGPFSRPWALLKRCFQIPSETRTDDARERNSPC